jgi:Protein of unknown function (DUF4238)
MSAPRDHHFIPVFYLQGWATDDGKLIEYSRPYKKTLVAKRVGPRATGFQKDLYSFLDCPPELAQHLESVFLQRTDSLASRALAKLLSDNSEPWPIGLRSAWSRFRINFLIRHPDPFAEVKSFAQSILLKPDGITQQQYERLRNVDDPATFEEWMLKQEGNLFAKNCMRLITAALDNEVAGGRFNEMIWDVLDVTKSNFRLLTSDWPLCRQVTGNRMQFALPISPTKLFVSVSDPKILVELRHRSLDPLVKNVNVTVVSSARLYVYDSDRGQETFVSKRMSSILQPAPFFPSLTKLL